MRLSLRDILLLCLCHNSLLQMMLSLLNHVINDAVTDELAAKTDQWSTQSEHSTCSARPHTQRCDVGRYGVASKAATDQIQQTNVRSLGGVASSTDFRDSISDVRQRPVRNKAAPLAVQSRPAAKWHIGNNRTSVRPSVRPSVQ